MQFLVKKNDFFLGQRDNLQEELFSDHLRNGTRDRKQYMVPTHMRSEWEVKPHQLLSLSVDQPLLVPLFEA